MAAPKKRHAEAYHTTAATGGTMADINITPLIDVMLVLLIIFMVVTPLAQRGLDIALPQAAPPKVKEVTPPSQQVVLGVDENGVTINRTPVTAEDLENRLKDIFQTRSDKTIFVRGSGKVPYGQVVAAMDAARGAGVDRIGIISEAQIEAAGGVVDGAPAAPAPQ